MSIYLSSSLGTTNNKVTFNDYARTPIYRLQSRQPQRRSIRELDIPIPLESGISDFETLIGQTIYVLEGTMYPGSEYEHASGLAALRKLSSLEIEQADVLSDDGYVPYTWAEDTGEKILYVKVLYVQLLESTRMGLVQPFRLICKVKDPTIYGSTLRTASTQQANPSTSTGAAVFGFTFPIVFGASVFSYTSDAQNDGDLPTYPIGINIYGPVNSPKITNTTTGEYIQVTNNVGADQILSIAYDKDSLSVTLDGVSVLNNVTANSTYFKLRPGSNPIELTGSSIGDGAYVTVTYRDAYPLS